MFKNLKFFLLILTVLVSATGIQIAKANSSVTASVPSSFYSYPHQMIPVQGLRRINLFCMGSGTPVVLLNSGLGGNIIDWRHVQGEVSKFTRVCSYDRAGYGFSDAASRPSDVANTADDLHRLIKAAKIAPVVYVGHSIAGFYGIYLEAIHPDDVAGAVFVDPALVRQDDEWIAALSPQKRLAFLTQVKSGLQDQKNCYDLSLKGELTVPKTKLAVACMDSSSYPDHLDKILKTVLAQQWASPKMNSAFLSELENASPTSENMSVDNFELGTISRDFYDKPLIVLTHSDWRMTPGFTSKEQATMIANWTIGHNLLAKTSTQGKNVLVPNSGHFIQIDQPPAVIDAVRQVVNEIRLGTK